MVASSTTAIAWFSGVSDLGRVSVVGARLGGFPTHDEPERRSYATFYFVSAPPAATVRAVDGPQSKASLAMARYGQGDEAAFGEVYDELSTRLFRYLVRLTRDDSRAEDLLQQTFLQMHDARGRFQQGADVVPWAYAIARRLFIDGTRRRKRDHLHDEYEDDRSAAQNREPTGEAVTEARELSEALQKRLEELPPLQRDAFRLVREEGLSMAEAAEILGVTPAAVKLRAHRAYESLRDVLAKLGEDVP
jgi:RNA polymerase sigma-70 factor (ECF subfamily)